MKKTLSILTALIILLCSFVMTSCQHTIVADEDTWYHTKKTVSEVDLDIWFYYTSNEKPLDKNVKNSGLTIVVAPYAASSSINFDAYAVKNFPFNVETTVAADADDTDPDLPEGDIKITPNGTFMDALYLVFKNDFKSSANQIPYVFSSNRFREVTKISDLGIDLKGKGWKGLLKDILNEVL